MCWHLYVQSGDAGEVMSNVVLKSPWPDVIVATTAVAGTPGTYLPSGAQTPATGAQIATLTASPTSAWTSGQYVVATNSDERYWNGTSWQVGRVPAGGTVTKSTSNTYKVRTK